MIRAKNYATVSEFVKVMPEYWWLHFFPNTVYNVIRRVRKKESEYSRHNFDKILDILS